MKKLHEIIEFVDEAFSFNKYAWLFIFFSIGLLTGILLFNYYGELKHSEINKIINLNNNNSNLLSIIATVTGTILTITVSLSPSLLSQLNKRYKNDQLKNSYLLEPSYIVTKGLGLFLIAFSVITMVFSISPLARFVFNALLTMMFLASLFAFAKLITKIEEYVSNTDAMLLKKFEKEVDKILK